MEHRKLEDDELEEEISDSFLCCVCLELLYKPIVLSCGHISCFWCVHKSMNGLRQSHCPICRDPYLHFPSVCQKLHFLLKKLYPLAYRKREEQILKEEREQDCFSPQINDVIGELKISAEPGCNGTSVNSSSGDQREKESHSAAKSLCASPSRGNSPCINNGESEAAEIGDEEGFSRTKKDSKLISRDDLLCSACKKLLVRPVVLNCGHVYCEACIANPTEESEKIRCEECQALDPRGFPKVCLVLEQFLQETFPEDYISETGSTNTERRQVKNNTSSQIFHKGSPSLPFNNDYLWWANPNSNVHIGAGCDSCGVYPIVGDRYRCKDCKEEIGYDLCSDCYNTRSKLPGRFNQQHTPDHRLERVAVPQLPFVTRLLADSTNSVVWLTQALAGDTNDSVPAPDSDRDSSENLNEGDEEEESGNRNYSRSSSV